MQAYGIAAFRSRQQVMALSAAMTRAGIANKVVRTPHEIAIGCGLSVQFAMADYDRIRALFERGNYSAFVGFYRVTAEGTRLRVTPWFSRPARG